MKTREYNIVLIRWRDIFGTMQELSVDEIEEINKNIDNKECINETVGMLIKEDKKYYIIASIIIDIINPDSKESFRHTTFIPKGSVIKKIILCKKGGI